jgi:DNA-binding NtrC family response regulator
MTKTVLTVDDSRTMRDMLLLTLSDAGYRVVKMGCTDLRCLRAKLRM